MHWHSKINPTIITHVVKQETKVQSWCSVNFKSSKKNENGILTFVDFLQTSIFFHTRCFLSFNNIILIIKGVVQ